MEIKLPELDSAGGSSLIRHFMDLLGQFNTVVPNNNLFIVSFDNIPPIVSDANHSIIGETGKDGLLNIDSAVTIFNQIDNGATNGFALCRGANVPEEQITMGKLETDGQRANGLLPLIVTQGREYEQIGLTLNILETNISLIDHLFRPWIVFYSKQGGLSEIPVTTNITVYKLSRDTQKDGLFDFGGQNPVIRKIWRFYDCAPVKILQSDTFEHTQEMELVEIPIQFRYNRYDVGLPAV